MTDYKHTLNLPATDFAMKANLAEREPHMLAFWSQINLYQKLRQTGEGRPKFILHNGPPYANGDLHVGHALSYVLKDIVTKAKTLSGFDSPFIFGWDCHGLPIEVQIEKKLGKPGVKVSADAFRQACREYAEKQIVGQKRDLVRLGIISDWDNPYRTMDFTYEADIIRSLAKIVENGHFTQGYKPVHWCIDCRSALAEAEVEYADKASPSIDVLFKVVDIPELLKRVEMVSSRGNSDITVVIWTTTPWTLPANQAVAIHPDLDYVLVETPQHCLLLAETLVEPALTRYGITDYRIVARAAGKTLAGLKLAHPFYDKTVPLILGQHVTADAGTGCVHTAPAHGVDDYAMGVQYKLPLEQPVAANGCYTEQTPLVAGLSVLKANDTIIELLKNNNTLLHQQKLNHSYPHCWRHKTPTIFRATPQWFISMDKNGLRQKALKEIERVDWLPEWGKARISGMVETRPDWCISRQRVWCVPIPIFTHKDTGQLHPNTIALMHQVADKVAQKGIEAWYALEAAELLGAEAEYYEKSPDGLDVWFDSGVSHEAVLKRRPELSFPADLYLEGSDQHRGWFNSSLMTSVAMNGVAPYKQVLTHAYTVDGQGRKMSKSLGNVISCEAAMTKYGADLVRLWVSAVDYRVEPGFSDEILKRTAEAYRRMRNTARFLLANLHGFDPALHRVVPDKMLALDKYIVDAARRLQVELIAAYDSYQFHVIYQKVLHFCSLDLGGFYLDVIKDRQYTTAADSLARRSAQTALYDLVECLALWLAPILSFTAEEIWQHIPGSRTESVFLSAWRADLLTLSEKDTMGALFWEKIMPVRDVVNKAIEQKRTEGTMGGSLEAEVTLYVDSEYQTLLKPLSDELRFVLITSTAKVQPLAQKPSSALSTELPGVWLEIQAASTPKCTRCWHRRADVGARRDHLELCGRCVDNISGVGEERCYA